MQLLSGEVTVSRIVHPSNPSDEVDYPSMCYLFGQIGHSGQDLALDSPIQELLAV